MTILLLPDVFKNSRNMSWNICTWSCSFSSASGLTLEAAFKKTKVKLELLTGIDMLLLVENGIVGIIFHAICRYDKVDIKYMKNIDQNKES